MKALSKKKPFSSTTHQVKKCLQFNSKDESKHKFHT